MNAPTKIPGGTKNKGAGQFIGKAVPRKEDYRLLTGHGKFVDDISVPGMLHVAFARSPIARGEIQSINLAVARDIEGVHAIYTQADLAEFNVNMISFFMAPQDTHTTPLADGRVAFVGDPVALVIANTRAIAEDAASLIEVEYLEQTPVVTIADARNSGPIHPDREDNINSEMGDEELDESLVAIFDNAAHVIDHKVIHQRISQSPMETRGVVVQQEGPNELTIYITCQSPHTVARWLSIALGMPQKAIRVIAKDVGGAFGLKQHPWKEETAVILASMKFGRPLKWIEDRYENLISANQARDQEMTLKVAFDDQGKLLGAFGAYDLNLGAFPHLSDCNIAVHMFLWAAYKLPAYGFISRGWYTNTVGYGAYRGPWAMESLVRETALDKAARAMGMDPIEMRRKNLVTLQDQPTVSCMQLPIEDITPAECLEKLFEYFDIAAFRQQQAEARKEDRYLGVGIASYVEPTGSAGAIAMMTGEPVQVSVDPTGGVTAILSTHSQGHGTATTMAQIIADRLGVPYEEVTVFEGDSSRGGFAPGASGSRQGVIGGGAAIMASDMLVDKIRQLAAHLLELNPEDIYIEGGIVKAEGKPDIAKPLAEIAAVAYGEPDKLPPGFEAGLTVNYRYQPPPMTLTSATNLCVVEVDRDTGIVSILRWISSEDCGTVINPAIVEGQVSGGLAQAIGTVLTEKMPFDKRGNPLAATYKDYHLPAISDIPTFEFVHCNTPSQSVGGMRGVGEGGAIIGPPTLVNAISDALAPFGEIEVDLPLTPAKVLSVMEGRDLTKVRSAETAQSANPPASPEPATQAAPQPTAAPEPEAAAAAGPAKVDGDWKMVLSTPMGPQEMQGHFSTDGDNLSGYLQSPEGQQEFTGKVEGNKVIFDLKVEKPMKITLKYNLVVEGDKISGKVKMGMFGSAKLAGERI